LEHIDVIRDSPSEIYHHALPFSPSSSWLRECYSSVLSREVRVVKGLQAKWGICSLTVSFDCSPQTLAYWKDIVAVGLESGNINVLDAISGIRTSVLSGHTGWVWSLAFSSDGMFLVSGSDDKTIKLWDIQTGGIVKTFCGHTGRVCSVSVSPDHTTIASGSDDKTVRSWDIRTGECRCVMDGHSETVNSVSFSPTNSRLLVSASDDHTVRQWDDDGCQIGPVYEGDDVAFSSDGTRFVSWRGGVVTVRNSDSGAVVSELQESSTSLQHCFSSDGKFVASTAFNTIYVWDVTSSDPRLIKTFIGHAEYITCLAFPSSLISLSCDESIKFWQIGAPSTAVIESESTLSTPVSIKSVSLQAVDGIAISSNSVGVVRTWDISTGLHKKSFNTPAREIEWGDAEMIGSKLIFSWYTGTKIHLWDTEKGELQTVVPRFYFSPIGFRISESGSRVFLLEDKSIRAWSICTGGVADEAKFEGEPLFNSLAVRGSRVWVRFGDSRVKGWDFWPAGSSPIPLSGLSLLLIPGRRLEFIDCTGARNTDPSRIRDTVTGKEVFRLSGRYRKPTVARWDGRYLVAGYKYGEVLILDFDHMRMLPW
jgi:WD40 repeat protein